MENSLIREDKRYALTADKHGKVNFLMVAGKDNVSNVMSVEGALRILKDAVKVEDASDKFPNYPICADWKFYFPGTIEVPTPLMGEEPQEETPPPKHHGFGKKRK